MKTKLAGHPEAIEKFKKKSEKAKQKIEEITPRHDTAKEIFTKKEKEHNEIPAEKRRGDEYVEKTSKLEEVREEVK